MFEGFTLLLFFFFTIQSCSEFGQLIFFSHRKSKNKNKMVSFLIKFIPFFGSRAKLREIMARAQHDKQKALQDDIVAAHRWFDEVQSNAQKSIDWTNPDEYTIVNLVKAQVDGHVTAVELLQCFMRKAISAHHHTNCITEMMLSDAIASAQACDEHLKNTGMTKGPLHGIPISIKESFQYRGTDSTLGLFKYALNPRTEDAAVVRGLHDAGAVLFVKTSVPQCLLTFECDNPVMGVTSNPFSQRHTPGGSSGGEGALLALNGAAAGVGTDIGGSIRIPAHFCGIYGLKPSSGRVPIYGHASSIAGQEAIPSIAGPMTRSMADLHTMFAVLSASSKYDANSLQIPPYVDPSQVTDVSTITKPKKQNKIRIGYYVDDEFYPAVASCARAVYHVVNSINAIALSEVNEHFSSPEFTTVEFVPMKLDTIPHRLIMNFYGLLGADRTVTLKRLLGNERPHSLLANILRLTKFYALPRWISLTVARFVKAKIDFLIGCTLENGCLASPHTADTFRLTAERNRLRQEFYTLCVEKYEVDALLTPAFACPAPVLGSASRATFGTAYTSIFNILDWPALTLPVTRLTESEALHPPTVEEETRRAGGHSPVSSKVMCQMCGRGAAGDDDGNNLNRQAAVGLPVGVQIAVPGRGGEERLMEVATFIDAGLRINVVSAAAE